MAPPSFTDAPAQSVQNTLRHKKYNQPQELDLQKHNEELEKRLQESLMREEKMREELRRAMERARVAEEAEEMLCSQLGELEAEAVDHVRGYHARISALMEQLQQAQKVLQAHAIPIKSL